MPPLWIWRSALQIDATALDLEIGATNLDATALDLEIGDTSLDAGATDLGVGVEFAFMAKPDSPAKPATAATVHGAVQPRFGEVRVRQRGRLPHWEKEEGLYFITFHVVDSLPRAALEKIAERNRILNQRQNVWAHICCRLRK